jgi:hypothetical protein
VGRWDQNGSYGDWLGVCGLDSTVSGQGPVAGCCECGDEPSGSCATELVSSLLWRKNINFNCMKTNFPGKLFGRRKMLRDEIESRVSQLQ